MLLESVHEDSLGLGGRSLSLLPFAAGPTRAGISLALGQSSTSSFSAGSVDFGPDVTSSDKSIKVLLNAQDKVSPAHMPRGKGVPPSFVPRWHQEEAEPGISSPKPEQGAAGCCWVSEHRLGRVGAQRPEKRGLQAQLGSCSRQSPCVQRCVVPASRYFGALTAPVGIPPCQAAGKHQLPLLPCWGLWLGWPRAGTGEHGALHLLLRCSLQVFSQIRNEHFSSVFGFLSQKSRNLQAQYDVSIAPVCGTPTVPSLRIQVTSPGALSSIAAAWHGHQANEGLCLSGTEGTKARASPAEPA